MPLPTASKAPNKPDKNSLIERSTPRQQRNSGDLMAPRVIHLHQAAPAKPPVGAACNGCGVCCAAEPCPLGMLVSRRLQGRCAALLWIEAGTQYRCGVLQAPGRWLPWLPRSWSRRLVRRWIAASRGCDSQMSALRAG